MRKRPRTATERPQAGAFLIANGAVVAGIDPILVLVETEYGVDLLLTDGSQGQLADGRYEFHAGITRGPIDAVGKSDFFPELSRPTGQRQHPHKALRRTRSPLRTA